MADKLEDRYEKAAEKVRRGGTENDRKSYHKLRDELVERTRQARQNRGAAGTVTAEQNEAS